VATAAARTEDSRERADSAFVGEELLV
jgi:hypothetical protein